MLCLFAVLFGMPAAAYAQTATADWTTLGLGNFDAVPNGAATTTSGGRTVSVTQTSSTDGGTFAPVYSSAFLSYYTGTISTQTGPLLLNFDNSDYDADDKVTSTYTFDGNVTGLTFRLLDVDRDVDSAQDAVEVYVDNGSGTFVNAALTAAFYTVGSTNSRTTNGYLNGFLGNSASGLSSTNGDITFNFGATTVKRIRIVYFSGQSQTGNPTGNQQYIGISDFRYNSAVNADLSLNKTVSNSSPLNATTISYNLSVTSAAGSDTAANVTVRDVLPSGVIFQSASGYGTYNSGTGIWTLPSIAAGQTRTLTINALVDSNQGVAVTNIAEIQTSPNGDPDSTPGNGIASEDDYSTANFTVPNRTAGTPPNISAICAASNSTINLLDWNNHSWTSGSATGSATLPTIGTVNFSVATQGSYNAPLALTSNNTGGFGAGQLSLYQSIEYTTAAQTTTTTITLPTGVAVPGVQFTVFDVDYNYNDFTDKLTVTGTYNGAAVTPILTNGTANYISGASAIGDQASSGTESGGNVVITFNQPVDTITIVYGNGPIATTDPDGQAISIYDFNFCNPSTSLSVTKISNVVSDPVNGTTNSKAIPGATVRYCILVTNPGTAIATAVTATDNLPNNISYVAGTMRSGANCGSAATVEDDDASDGGETDGTTASITGDVITINRASLAAGVAVALTFQTIVN